MELFPLLCRGFLLYPWVGAASAQEIGPGPGVVNVPEGDDALLPCVLGSGQSIDEFDWRKDNGDEEKMEVFMYKRGSYYGNSLQGQNEQFTDRVVFFQHELQSGNASIIVKNTRLEDSGTYTCGLLKQSRQEINIRLNVDGDLKIRHVLGAAPLPYINQTFENDRVLLECKAQGVPKPEVEWRNSAGYSFSDEDKLMKEHKDASGRFHVGLQVKVSRGDTYTCVVTQRGIYHQINRTVNVPIQEHSTGLVITVTVVITTIVLLLIVAIIIGGLCSKGCLAWKSSEQGQSPTPETKPLSHINSG